MNKVFRRQSYSRGSDDGVKMTTKDATDISYRDVHFHRTRIEVKHERRVEKVTKREAEKIEIIME